MNRSAKTPLVLDSFSSLGGSNSNLGRSAGGVSMNELLFALNSSSSTSLSYDDQHKNLQLQYSKSNKSKRDQSERQRRRRRARKEGEKVVRFGTTTIQEYKLIPDQQTIGEVNGPYLTIDWDVVATSEVPAKEMGRYRKHSMIMLSPQERKSKLKKASKSFRKTLSGDSSSSSSSSRILPRLLSSGSSSSGGSGSMSKSNISSGSKGSSSSSSSSSPVFYSKLMKDAAKKMNSMLTNESAQQPLTF